MVSSIYKIFPGIIFCFVIAYSGIYLSDFIGKEILNLKKSPISPIMLSIIFGLLIGNIFHINNFLLEGIKFSLKFILRLGIICLGIRLGLLDIFKVGIVGIPLIVACIIISILVVNYLCKLLNVSSKMGSLIAVGTSICGASAIVATSPAINADKEEVAYAIANITIFGIIAMFLYPFMAYYLFSGDELASGLFLGTSIHETAQVAAAGLIYDQQFNSPETLNVATVTKLIRNTCLVFLIPLFAYLNNKDQINKSAYSILNIFPLFVIGFIGMIFLRNIGDQLFVSASEISTTWINIISITKMATTLFLTMAMSAIGLSINLSELKNIGVKPFIVGFVVALAVGIVSISILENFL